jgi:hypothetical protein
LKIAARLLWNGPAMWWQDAVAAWAVGGEAAYVATESKPAEESTAAAAAARRRGKLARSGGGVACMDSGEPSDEEGN